MAQTKKTVKKWIAENINKSCIFYYQKSKTISHLIKVQNNALKAHFLIKQDIAICFRAFGFRAFIF